MPAEQQAHIVFSVTHLQGVRDICLIPAEQFAHVGFSFACLQQVCGANVNTEEILSSQLPPSDGQGPLELQGVRDICLILAEQYAHVGFSFTCLQQACGANVNTEEEILSSQLPPSDGQGPLEAVGRDEPSLSRPSQAGLWWWPDSALGLAWDIWKLKAMDSGSGFSSNFLEEQGHHPEGHFGDIAIFKYIYMLEREIDRENDRCAETPAERMTSLLAIIRGSDIAPLSFLSAPRRGHT
jgi:hypothetical protein